LRLPPHNQRRITAALRDLFGPQHPGCIPWLLGLQERGYTHGQMAEEAEKLGVSISLFAIRAWLIDVRRERPDTTPVASVPDL